MALNTTFELTCYDFTPVVAAGGNSAEDLDLSYSFFYSPIGRKSKKIYLGKISRNSFALKDPKFFLYNLIQIKRNYPVFISQKMNECSLSVVWVCKDAFSTKFSRRALACLKKL